MSDGENIKNPLKRDGTSRPDRFPAALDPASVLVDGKSEKDLVEFTHSFAALVKYYGPGNIEDGDWQLFFSKLKDLLDGKKTIEKGYLDPHLGLFRSFLHLFRLHQQEINKIPKRHLDFFFKKVLQFARQEAVPDSAHLTFELAKNTRPTLVSKGTQLKAGKDDTGVELIYELDEDIIVNKAKVSKLMSLYVDDGNNSTVHKGDFVNSPDGKGEEDLDESDPSWPAFGSDAFEKADIGFALASPVLWLKEGERNIRITIELLPDSGTTIPSSVLENAFRVYLSGEKDWLGPYSVTPSYSVSGGKATLSFSLDLNGSEDPVSFYDPEIYTDNIGTVYPVMKVLLNKDAEKYIYEYLRSSVIQSAKIKATVTGISDLTVENDQGTVDASKPFMPFGSRPLKGSSFLVGSEEAFSKKLDDFTLHAEWQDVPSGDMKDYYGSFYTGDDDKWMNYSLGSNAFKAKMYFRKKGSTIDDKTVDLFNTTNNTWSTSWSMVDNSLFAFVLPVYQLQQTYYYSQNYLFSNSFTNKLTMYTGQGIMQNALAWVVAPAADQKLKSGYVRFELLHDFLHKDYTEKYTKAVAQFQNWGSDELKLPKEPYTPLIKNISLDYEATSEFDFSLASQQDYISKELELHQLGAFGSREVHGYLSSNLPDTVIAPLTLLPDHSNAGELYIGIEDIETDQSLNLLVQVAEGSADPLADTEQVTWSVLTDEHWLPLDDDHLLADNTNGFLESGIVKIMVPDKASLSSDWLPDGYLWLRASIKNNTDAVCKLTGIHSQAGRATFKDQGNDPVHLKEPLEAETISKFVKAIAGIKKVVQPYASFGGEVKETDKDYYVRVSERLRHKSRAVTIFDYERMILEKFPNIYKVKCLNHTSPASEMAPGNVTLVIVPDLTNQNAVNKLEPRVSKAVLENVKSYVEEFSTEMAEIHTRNPDYEKIRLDFKVRFGKSYEFGYYKNQLNEDIIGYLSPWATGASTEISFGGKIHKSVLLKFIEEREYVDFVTDFRMFHLRGGADDTVDVDEAIAGSGDAILVSHDLHIINNYQES